MLRAGQQARISATIENPLRPGRYTVVCWAAHTRDADEAAHQTMKLLQFVVFGVEGGPGIVSVPGELGVELESAPAPPERGSHERRGGARAAGRQGPIRAGRRVEAVRRSCSTCSR